MSEVIVLSDWEDGDEEFMEIHYADSGQTRIVTSPNFPKVKVEPMRLNHKQETVFRITIQRMKNQ